MKKLFDLVSTRHKEITKQAFLGPLMAAGKLMVKNPLKLLNPAFNSFEMASAGREAAQQMGKTRARAAELYGNLPSSTM